MPPIPHPLLTSPAFLPSTPIPRPPTSTSTSTHPYKTPLHPHPICTYSLPVPHSSPFHSDETKTKIGLSVHRTVAARNKRVSTFLLSLQPSSEPSTPNPTPQPPSTTTPSSPSPSKPRRRMSAESRAKISAALKGRAKSPEHRASLRKRFVGDGNPMFGRRMSAESRAKISAAMSDLARRKREAKGSVPLTDEMKQGLREKAVASRLFQTQLSNKTVQREIQDHVDAKEVEQILGKVRAGQTPPENVQRAVERDRKMKLRREEKENAVCAVCQGSGFVKCPCCVGAFGVASGKCAECFGAGAVFCCTCQGSGRGAVG